MKFFIDTANIDEIKEIASWGVLAGVTTNPSLISKESGKDFKTLITEITGIVDGAISAEVVSTDAAGMIKEGREYAKWHPNIVVKIPTIPEGLKAIAVLSKEGIKINATLIFSPAQALLVARAGATYCSPFLGRMEDIGEDGIQLVSDIVAIFETHDLDTQVIAASIRSVKHVTDAALVGSHVATIPYKVFKQMIKHQLTDAGLEKFLADWNKTKK